VSLGHVQLEREFEELDVDHDGFITAEDLVAASRSAPTNSNNAGEGEEAHADYRHRAAAACILEALVPMLSHEPECCHNNCLGMHRR
jgi:hypothetical protein